MGTCRQVAIALVFAAVAAAQTLGVGAPLPALTLVDQHDVALTIGPETRVILFTRDMDAGDLVKEALAEDGAARLAEADALVVADIERMPGVITTLFALPAMRKRPYRMLLDRDGKATAMLPSEEGKVTVLTLDALTITGLTYADSAAAVRGALEAARR